jgi:hypothetical protein
LIVGILFCGDNMPSFDSPIGGKKFYGTPMKEFEVPDETEYSSEIKGERFSPSVTKRYAREPLNLEALQEFQSRIQGQVDPDSQLGETEREMKAAREARRSGKERLNAGAKKRIEMLLGMTRSNREVVVGQNSFVLQTLKSKELSEALTAAAEFDGTVQSPFEIRRQLLARALTTISGIDFDSFIGSNDMEDKLFFVDNMDHALLLRLNREYQTLVTEHDELYAIKSPEDAKEVLEDLKK